MNEFEYKGFTYSSDDSRLGDKESAHSTIKCNFSDYFLIE